MAITLVGTAEGANTGGGTISLSLPGGTAENDVVLVYEGDGLNGNLGGMSTAGYTTIFTETAAVPSHGLYSKVMGSTPDTTAVVAVEPSAQRGHAAIAFVLRGVDTSNITDTTSTTAGPTTSTNPNSPSITTVTDGAWVLSLATSAVNDTAVTAPSGYSNQVDINSDGIFSDATVGGATFEKSTAGAEDPASWTNWASGAWRAASVAIRPASSGQVFVGPFTQFSQPLPKPLPAQSFRWREDSLRQRNFAGSVTEAATATEVQSVIAVFAAAITEAATATDTPSATYITSASRTEAASATDTPSANAIFRPSITESASAAESESAAAIFRPSITESATATETQSSTQTQNDGVTETCTATSTQDSTTSPSGLGPQRVVRDWWNRDSQGRFMPGSGTRRV